MYSPKTLSNLRQPAKLQTRVSRRLDKNVKSHELESGITLR
jgi:hypothetical protein